jgi:hypothetical protein
MQRLLQPTDIIKNQSGHNLTCHKNIYDIWDAVLSDLSTSIDFYSFESYIKPLMPLPPEEVYPGLNLEPKMSLFILAKNTFIKNFIKKTFIIHLNIALKKHDIQHQQWDIITQDEVIKLYWDCLPPERMQKAGERLQRLQEQTLSGSIVPNVVAKSMLFKPIKKGPRPYYKDWHEVPLIHSLKDQYSLAFRHEQLDQADLTAYLLLLKLAQKHPGMVAIFSGYELLRLMNKTDSEYKWLYSFLNRITSTQILIARPSDGLFSNGPPSDVIFYQEALAPALQGRVGKKQQKFRLQLSKSLFHLLGFDSWSYIDLDSRFALGNSQHALALQSFLSATTSPHIFKVMEIIRLWGSGTKITPSAFLADFRRRCIKPLLDIGFLTNVEESRQKKLEDRTMTFYFSPRPSHKNKERELLEFSQKSESF